MFGKFGLAAATLLVSVVPALADNACGGTPIAPAAVDGSTATTQQMKDAHEDVMNFMKASDDYQSCILKQLADKKDAAAKAKDPKPLDPSIEKGVNAEVDANQRDKEKVGAEFNASVIAFKAAHK